MERNNLMSKCYPRIKDYCREKHGLEFQVWTTHFTVIDQATTSLNFTTVFETDIAWVRFNPFPCALAIKSIPQKKAATHWRKNSPFEKLWRSKRRTFHIRKFSAPGTDRRGKFVYKLKLRWIITPLRNYENVFRLSITEKWQNVHRADL